MDRRRFLAYAITWLVSVVSWVPGSLFSKTPGIHSEILNSFSELESMKQLGKYYLEIYPEHADKKWLKDYLFTEYKKNVHGVSMKEYLRQRSEDDFRRSCTVSIQGWVLSLTEARFYALVSLWS